MKITFTNTKDKTFSNLEERRCLARKVSDLISHQFEFEPYMTTEGDHSYWTVDPGNDWKIKFIDNKTFQLIHRYSQSPVVQQEMQVIALELATIYECETEIMP